MTLRSSIGPASQARPSRIVSRRASRPRRAKVETRMASDASKTTVVRRGPVDRQEDLGLEAAEDHGDHNDRDDHRDRHRHEQESRRQLADDDLDAGQSAGQEVVERLPLLLLGDRPGAEHRRRGRRPRPSGRSGRLRRVTVARALIAQSLCSHRPAPNEAARPLVARVEEEQEPQPERDPQHIPARSGGPASSARRR